MRNDPVPEFVINTEVCPNQPQDTWYKPVQFSLPSSCIVTGVYTYSKITCSTASAGEGTTSKENVDKIVGIINKHRQSGGFSVLVVDDRLAKAAEIHNNRIARAGQLFHDSFDKEIRAENFPVQDCGVKSGFGNISQGLSGGPGNFEPELLTESLYDDDAHRRDVMDPAFNKIGAAYFTSDSWSCVTVNYGAICKEEPTPGPITLPISFFSQF